MKRHYSSGGPLQYSIDLSPEWEKVSQYGAIAQETFTDVVWEGAQAIGEALSLYLRKILHKVPPSYTGQLGETMGWVGERHDPPDPTWIEFGLTGQAIGMHEEIGRNPYLYASPFTFGSGPHGHPAWGRTSTARMRAWAAVRGISNQALRRIMGHIAIHGTDPHPYITVGIEEVFPQARTMMQGLMVKLVDILRK